MCLCSIVHSNIKDNHWMAFSCLDRHQGHPCLVSSSGFASILWQLVEIYKTCFIRSTCAYWQACSANHLEGPRGNRGVKHLWVASTALWNNVQSLLHHVCRPCCTVYALHVFLCWLDLVSCPRSRCRCLTLSFAWHLPVSSCSVYSRQNSQCLSIKSPSGQTPQHSGIGSDQNLVVTRLSC